MYSVYKLIYKETKYRDSVLIHHCNWNSGLSIIESQKVMYTKAL